MATGKWAEAVLLAKAVQEGRIDSYGRAAQELAAYILQEQQQIELALAEAKCPFPEEEADTSPEVPFVKHNTLPYPIQSGEDEEDSFSDTTLVDFHCEVDGPKTGVLNAPQTGIRPREVLPLRHNSPDGKKR